MFEKDFVPYDEALALKELGFDDSCIYHFKKNNEDKPSFIFTFEITRPFGKNHNTLESRISAPTFSQAFRWFREKYNMKVCFDWHPTEQDRFCIYFSKSSYFEKCDFKSKEDAELACLRNMIRLVKENKQNVTEIEI